MEELNFNQNKEEVNDNEAQNTDEEQESLKKPVKKPLKKPIPEKTKKPLSQAKLNHLKKMRESKILKRKLCEQNNEIYKYQSNTEEEKKLLKQFVKYCNFKKQYKADVPKIQKEIKEKQKNKKQVKQPIKEQVKEVVKEDPKPLKFRII